MNEVAEANDLIIITFQLPKSLAVKARIAASSINVSRSEFIRRALAAEIDKQKKEAKLYAA